MKMSTLHPCSENWIPFMTSQRQQQKLQHEKNNRASSTVKKKTNEVRLPCICKLHFRCLFQSSNFFPPPAQYPTQTHAPESFLHLKNFPAMTCAGISYAKKIFRNRLVKIKQNFGCFWVTTIVCACKRTTELKNINSCCSACGGEHIDLSPCSPTRHQMSQSSDEIANFCMTFHGSSRINFSKCKSFKLTSR